MEDFFSFWWLAKSKYCITSYNFPSQVYILSMLAQAWMLLSEVDDLRVEGCKIYLKFENEKYFFFDLKPKGFFHLCDVETTFFIIGPSIDHISLTHRSFFWMSNVKHTHKWLRKAHIICDIFTTLSLQEWSVIVQKLFVKG